MNTVDLNHGYSAINAEHQAGNTSGKYKFIPTNLLRPKRSEDVKPTLWNTYNTVQEKFLKGGRYVHAANRMREVKSINDNIKLNKTLWSLTEKMAELKAA